MFKTQLRPEAVRTQRKQLPCRRTHPNGVKEKVGYEHKIISNKYHEGITHRLP